MAAKLAILTLFLAVDPALSGESLGSLLKGKIKHIIVLMEENRSFDHLFGFSALPVERLKGDEWNLVNTSNPAGPRITVSDNAVNVNPCDPDHSTPATLAKMARYRSSRAAKWEAFVEISIFTSTPTTS